MPNSSGDEQQAALVAQRRNIQHAIDARVAAIAERLSYLATARAELILRSGQARRTATKRGRETDSATQSVLEGPLASWPNHSALPPRHVFPGEETVPATPWEASLDGALCDAAAALGAAELASFNVSTWSGVRVALTDRLGADAPAPMACFLRFRQLKACPSPFQHSEDVLLQQIASRFGWRWLHVAKVLFSATKRFRAPADVAQRYMTLQPTLFWDTHLSRQAVWSRVRPSIRWPFVDVDTIVVSSSVRAANQSRSSCQGPLPKVRAVKGAVDHALVTTLARSSPLAYLEMLLCFQRSRLPIVGVPLDTLSSDARACAAQLSITAVANLCGCAVADIHHRVETALLERTLPPLTIDLEKTSRDLFGHTLCTGIVFRVACELQDARLR